VNWRPSRPADPPSGATSHFSVSVSPLGLGALLFSCDLRSVTGTRGRVAAGAVRVDLAVVLVERTSFPAAMDDLGEVRFHLESTGGLLGDAGPRRGLDRGAGGGRVAGGVSVTSMAAPDSPKG
jgi:hypothetical protein